MQMMNQAALMKAFDIPGIICIETLYEMVLLGLLAQSTERNYQTDIS